MPFSDDDLKINTPTFELIKDSRRVPRFDQAQSGTFSPEGTLRFTLFFRPLNLTCVAAREVIAALLNPNPCQRPHIQELYAYRWLQDARRRACRRELCLA